MRWRARGRVLVVVLPVLVLVAGGGAGYWFLLRGRPAPAQPEVTSYRVALDDLMVNLADRERPHYLRMSVTLVMSGVAPEKAAEDYAAEIHDAVITAASEHTYDDLLSTEGKEALKSDIAAAVEAVCGDDRLAVSDVLFTAFLME